MIILIIYLYLTLIFNNKHIYLFILYSILIVYMFNCLFVHLYIYLFVKTMIH